MSKNIYQKLLKEIKEFNKWQDKRGNPEGAEKVLLSNMSKGAKAFNISLTKKEIKISKLIGKELKREYFAGIDFIDQKLNGDINVTSLQD